MTDALKLRAETVDDLTVMSSALQDAILRVGDIQYDTQGRAVMLRLTRFRHEAEAAQERVLCGFRIDSVLSLKSRGLDRSDPDAMAVILAVEFKPAKTAPEGELHIILAGGGELRADVECVDVILADVADPRTTDKRPLHPDNIT